MIATVVRFCVTLLILQPVGGQWLISSAEAAPGHDRHCHQGRRHQGSCRDECKPGSPSCKESCCKAEEGFVPLFDGKTLEGWQGDLKGYVVKDGKLVCTAKGGNLLTTGQYSDFILRLEYRLRPGGNNGIAIRAPLKGNPTWDGMEIQILDDSFPQYQNFKPVQFNGSIYGAVAAKRGHMKPVGEWNQIEIMAKGTHVKVTLNGTVILEADTSTIGPMEIHGRKLTGLQRTRGYVGFLGHHHRVEFRNIRIKELRPAD